MTAKSNWFKKKPTAGDIYLDSRGVVVVVFALLMSRTENEPWGFASFT
jgi:hypothetical protein